MTINLRLHFHFLTKKYAKAANKHTDNPYQLSETTE